MESTNTTPIQDPGGALWAGHSVPKTLSSAAREAGCGFWGRTAWLHEGLAREVGLRLLDAVERIDALDRRFQIRSRSAADRNGTVSKGKG